MDDAVAKVLDLASRVAVAESRLKGLDDTIKLRFETLEAAMKERLSALQKAKDDQDSALDSRLNTMNHIKDSLLAQADRFATKDSVEARFNAIDADLRILRTAKDKGEGAATQKQLLMTTAVALIALFSALVAAVKAFGK